MIGSARLECGEPAAEASELIRRQLGDSFGDFFDFHVRQYSTWLSYGKGLGRRVLHASSSPTRLDSVSGAVGAGNPLRELNLSIVALQLMVMRLFQMQRGVILPYCLFRTFSRQGAVRRRDFHRR